MRLPAALTLLLGCGGTERATRVTVSTDAPPGLFDRVVLEVRVDGVVCDGCRRDLEASALPATFAVAAGERPAVVHAVLFRDRGEPARQASSIDEYVLIEPRAETLVVRLRWLDTGKVQGAWDAPRAEAEQALLQPRRPAECPALVPDDQACVRGGLFWLGDPALDLHGGIDREGNDERLVWLSTFLLDRREVTAGELRADGTALRPGCAGLDDEDAAACVTWRRADAYCRARGRRLPSEAQLEYALGGFVSRRFVWGDAVPECGDAVIGDCGHASAGPAGRGARDRLLANGGAELWDLVGNVAEWTGDSWDSTRGEGCFSQAVLVDPRCERSDEPRRSLKGGAYDLGLFYLGAAMRTSAGADVSDPALGFRCASQEVW